MSLFDIKIVWDDPPSAFARLASVGGQVVTFRAAAGLPAVACEASGGGTPGSQIEILDLRISGFWDLRILGRVSHPHILRFSIPQISAFSPSMPVVIGAGSHPFPFRTRKLSLLPPMVLHGKLCGRVGRCRQLIDEARCVRKPQRAFVCQAGSDLLPERAPAAAASERSESSRRERGWGPASR